MSSLAEIKTENEMVTRQQMDEYLNELMHKFYGEEVEKVDSFSLTFHTEYVNFTFHRTMEIDASIDMRQELDIVSISASISRMGGEMDVDDLLQASEELKAAAKIVEKFNDRMDGVLVIWF